jgi:hypothetical protein
LWDGLGDHPVRYIPWPNQAVKIWECPTAPHPLDGSQVAIVQRTNSFRDTFERYIAKDRHNKHLRRKVYTAIATKMARTVHGIIKHGEPDLPLL